MNHLLSPAVRRWVYSVAAASVPLIVALGWADAQTLALVLPMLLALLNINDPEDGDDA